MPELMPFYFDDFTEEKNPVLDLSLNRKENIKRDMVGELLKNIDAKLQILLEDRNKQNLKLIKLVLSDIAPVLVQKCEDDLIRDFIGTRFSNLIDQKVLDIYLPVGVVLSVKEMMTQLATKRSYSGHIRLHSDEKLSSSMCKIVWGSEEEVFSTEQILDKIRSQLNGVLENG